MSVLKRTINGFLARTGYVIKEARRLPSFHMFGLRDMPIRTILDIGANEGQFALAIRPVFPRARIISFEPIFAVFETLSSKAAKDPLWVAENLAFADFDGLKQMNVHLDHSPSSSFLRSTDREIELFPKTNRQQAIDINVHQLDSWVARTKVSFDAETLIKMDVQGMELAVIKGGETTISKSHAILVETSVQLLYEGQSTFSDLVSELHALGFSFQGVIDYGLDINSRVISFDSIFLR